MVDPNPAGETPPQKSFLVGLKEALANKINEIIVGGVVAGVGLIVVAGWSLSMSKTKDFIVATIADELKKNNAQLVSPIDGKIAELQKDMERKFADARKDEVGAIYTGQFILTPDNQYILSFYFPEGSGYTGTLTLALENLDSQKRWVVIQPADGDKFDFKMPYGTIPLQTLLQKTKMSFIESGLKQLRSLSFSLGGSAVDRTSGKFDPSSSINGNYVALVKPIIRGDIH